MNIKNFVEDWFIKMREDNAVVLEIYETGSQLLRDDPHDLDFEVICENFKQRFAIRQIEENGLIYDIMIIDRLALIEQLDFNSLHYVQNRLKMFNYMFAIRNTQFGASGIEWDMLEHESVYKSYLLETFVASKERTNIKTGYRRGKFYVHYYMVLKIYENNSIELTPDILSDVRKLYANTEDAHLVIDWVVEQIELIGGE